MRGILTEISRAYANEQYRTQLLQYMDMQKSEGWKVHQQMLLMMRGMIAEEMLSSRFTKLDEREKDVRQRAYHNVNEVIGFLLKPIEKAVKKAEFSRNFEREMQRHMQGATQKGATGR